MKKQLWKFALALALLVGLLAVGTIVTSAATEGYYTYTVSDGEATITNVNTSISGKVTVPATLGGYPVTSIGSYAFFSCSRLASITIPDSVTSIGSSAFYNCSSLTSITIPDSVTNIGEGAFGQCEGLTSITFGENSQLTSIGASVFENCKRLTRITIPDGVTSIGVHAFNSCSGLTSITFLSPNTTIYDDKDTIPAQTTIHGYEGSTAQAYAEKYNRTFVSLGQLYTPGDVDGVDGLDANDAIYLLYNVIFGNTTYPVNQPCDFNGDGIKDANDAIYLLYHVIFGAANYPLNS